MEPFEDVRSWTWMFDGLEETQRQGGTDDNSCGKAAKDKVEGSLYPSHSSMESPPWQPDALESPPSLVLPPYLSTGLEVALVDAAAQHPVLALALGPAARRALWSFLRSSAVSIL